MISVLVTGAAGFIGHHLVEYLLDNTSWDIVCLDRLDYSGNLNRIKEVAKDRGTDRITIVHHDLKAAINPQIQKLIGDPDFIVHMAAGSHVDRSIDYPMEFVQDNVIGTVNLMDYARELSGLKRFLYFSTDEVFGPAPAGVWYKEYDRYNSTNPYSASKAGAEELVVAYHNTYGLPAVVTHTMNVFGERQHPEKFIPMCIKRIRDGEKITVHADKTRTIPGSRHYIHAKDVCSAVEFILNLKTADIPKDDSGVKCPKFNIVGAEEIDNESLVKLIASHMETTPDYELIDFHSSRPGHDLRYALDGSLMKSLGWEPKDLRDRLAQTIDWSLENSRWLL